MQHVIYTKFSNEREERFCIRTQVYENDEGARCVRKFASSVKANEHIQKIYKSYKWLESLYKDTKLEINNCQLRDGYAEFEYIEGMTMEQQLDELLFSGQYQKFKDLFEEFLELLKGNQCFEEFSITPQFEEIFGVNEVIEGESSLPYTDIDMILSNVIVQDKKCVLIDYEWTYDFPIPFSYVLYRLVLNYFVANPRRKELCDEYCPLDLNISEYKLRIYQKMDDNFINYVSGGKRSIAQLYQDTEDLILTKSMLLELGEQRNRQRYQVYYDLGNDFLEENSKSDYQTATCEVHHLEIPIEQGCKRVRFDPSDYKGMLYIQKLSMANRELTLVTNGICINDKVIIFLEDDPWIMIDSNLDGNILEVEYQYTEFDDKQLHSMVDTWKKEQQQREEQRKQLEEIRVLCKNQTIENQNLQSICDEQRKKIDDMVEKEQQNILEQNELKQQLENLTNSLSWKVTKPLRKLRKIICRR